MPASEEERAALAQRRGRDAAKIADAKKRAEFIAEQGKSEAKGKDVDLEELKHKTDVFETGLALRGSLKRGGRVKRTGLYRLHKGERVVSAKKRIQRIDAASVLGKGKKNRMSRSRRTPAKVSLKVKGSPGAVLRAVRKVASPQIPPAIR
jgi:hypothetical protein